MNTCVWVCVCVCGRSPATGRRSVWGPLLASRVSLHFLNHEISDCEVWSRPRSRNGDFLGLMPVAKRVAMVTPQQNVTADVPGADKTEAAE